jgi:hypothetical protein
VALALGRRRWEDRAMSLVRPAACAAVLLGLALAVAGADDPSPASAAARKSCRTNGQIIVQRHGSGVISSRVTDDSRVIYTACSTRFGRRVRLATDDSELVDQIFSLRRTRVSGTAATFVYCVQYDTGADLYTVRANLRTGRARETSEPRTGDDCR